MIITLYIVSALETMAFAMTITTLRAYIVTLGGSHFFVGILGSTTALVSLIWNPVAGSLSDSIGRKPMLLNSLLICFVANALLTFSSSLIIVFVSRLLAAFGNQVMILVRSLADDNTKLTNDKTKIINRIQALTAFSFIVGSLASGHLSSFKSGPNFIFSLISTVYLINFGLIYFATVQQKKVETNSKLSGELTKAITNLKNLNWNKYCDCFAIKLVLEFTYSIFFSNFAFQLFHVFGITIKGLGYIIAFLSIIGIGTNLVMNKLKQKFYSQDEGGWTRLIHGGFLLSTAYLLLGVTSEFTNYILLLIPMSVAKAFLDSTLQEILLTRTSISDKGSVMASFDSVFPLAGLIAPITSGIIADIWGDSAPVLFCSLPIFTGIILMYCKRTK